MGILWRIIGMAARYPARLSLAYISALVAIGFSLALPWLFGGGIDLMVGQDADTKQFFQKDFAIGALVIFGAGILGVSLGRGFCDFARTYTTESLSQKVSFDCRNLLYDKLQNVRLRLPRPGTHRRPDVPRHRRCGGHAPLRQPGNDPLPGCGHPHLCHPRHPLRPQLASWRWSVCCSSPSSSCGRPW